MSIFRNRSVFLTGHTGFKGSWLAMWLQQLGAHVHGYALPAPEISLFGEARVADGLASHTLADIRDHQRLIQALRASRAEIVFHLAAQPLVRLAYEQPRETFEVNVQGTVNLLDAVRQSEGVRVVQIITSDKCYENREWEYAYRENDAMGGFDPYSASKGCAELVTAAYRRSFFHPASMDRHQVSVASARAGNVIGGGDWAQDRIIPDCIRSLDSGDSILVRNPRAIRPWQFVLEPLSGYLRLAEKQWDHGKVWADAFNFGPLASGCVTVAQVVASAIKHWGRGQWHTTASSDAAPHEANFLKLDITKSENLLEWHPTCTVDEAVALTIQWYKQRAAGGLHFDARELCEIQLTEFQKQSIAQLKMREVTDAR
ncbi:MAG TPA: CDP-glucose 4,6-dehydratase [Phycisphaerae bacterium]